MPKPIIGEGTTKSFPQTERMCLRSAKNEFFKACLLEMPKFQRVAPKSNVFKVIHQRCYRARPSLLAEEVGRCAYLLRRSANHDIFAITALVKYHLLAENKFRKAAHKKC